MAAAMASKTISRALLGFQSPTLRRRATRWHPSTRSLCWARKIPNAQSMAAVERPTHKPLDRVTLTRRVPSLDYGMKGGLKAEKENFPTEKLLLRRSVFGEYQLGAEEGSSNSQAPSCDQDFDTTMSSEEGDDYEEDHDIHCLRRADSTSSSDGLSTSGNSDVPPTGRVQKWFPYDNSFKLNDESTLTSAEVLSMLSPFLVDGRKQRIEEVVAHRTYSVSIVVEGLLDLGNISAVFRSADALGFQSVHVISNETKKRYKKNRKVSMGTEKWLDAEMWDSSTECIATLRKRGYRIAVTHIAPDTVSIHDMDWTIPTAVIFGNEHLGVSEEAITASDIRCSIPMAGMVDSFNVSVAAGILMHHAAHDRIIRAGSNGDISPADKKILEAEFCLRHNRQTVQILDRLVEKKRNTIEVSSLKDMFNEEFIAGIEEPEYLKL